jgi:DnaJ-class molecular chaperone
MKQVDCENCSGFGVLVALKECVECGDPPSLDCPSCEGAGCYELEVDCEECRGTGVVMVEESA